MRPTLYGPDNKPIPDSEMESAKARAASQPWWPDIRADRYKEIDGHLFEVVGFGPTGLVLRYHKPRRQRRRVR